MYIRSSKGRIAALGPTSRIAADLLNHPLSELVELRGDVADFKQRVEAARVALFGRCIRRLLTSASPLLLDLARMEGIDLVALVEGMEPAYGWPWRPDAAGFSPRAMFLRSHSRKRAPGPMDEDRLFRRRMGHMGVVVRPPSHPDGRLGVHVVGDTLSMVVDLGSHRLVTTSGGALLRAGFPLPETLLVGMVGVDLAAVFQHPLFDGRGYLVTGVEQSEDGLPIIIFATGEAPFAVPLDGAVDDVEGF